jgi:hypothetical protein
LTEASRVMTNTDFGEPGTSHRCHRGDEAMHLGIQRDVLDEVGPERFEGAAVVANRHSRDLGDQPVSNTRRNLPRHQFVLTIDAPTDDEMVALIDLLHERTYIRRVVLQIAIHRNKDVSARVLDPSRHGGGLSIVAPELDDP